MNTILDLIQDPRTTYHQKVVALAREAEGAYEGVQLTSEEKAAFETGLICDLAEGTAPYRPRYILPDYEKFMREGCTFLRLDPPQTLEEAVHFLLIFYRQIPSITTMPVYLGNLDTLLDPFITDETRDLATIRLFLIHLDRTITDSFTHANIGPRDTRAGRLILKAEAELKNAVPNLTLKYSSETPDEFALLAIEAGLAASKPSFANHDMYTEDFGDRYGIASCYNGLPVGGGGYTLVRMNLRRVAEAAGTLDRFMGETLTETVRIMGAVMEKRIRFIVEESRFFENSFLVKEGFISRDRFLGMFGIYGLAEAVNTLMGFEDKADRYGHSQGAGDLAEAVIRRLEELVGELEAPYSPLTENRYLLHAQSGISSDLKETPGARIPYGDEPEMLDHLIFTSRIHKYFPTGISDIFTFDETSKGNLKSVLDIIKGAMKTSLRMFAFYSASSDLVRITGFLVKKSDIEALKQNEAALHDTVALGMEAIENQRILERRVQKSHE
jgi:YjjI family glycine radical enzyme